ncbi:MAG: CHASE3 domain-containing protein [Pseudomonadota bacterium]
MLNSSNIFPNMRMRNKVLLGASIPLIFILILGTVSYINVNSISNTSYWVNFTHKVLSRADKLSAAAVDMETGMRGYLLSGREDFLGPYESGSKAFHENITSLKEMLYHNPEQLERLDRVEDIMGGWDKNVAKVQIDLRRDINKVKTMDHMAALISEGHSVKYLDKFRDQIALFKQNEQDFLAERKAKFENTLNSGNATVSQISENSKWVKFTHGVIADTDAVHAAAVDIETGMRGFLISGKEDFLSIYNDGSDRLFAQIAKIKEDVKHTAPQFKLMGEIETNMRQWLKDVAEPQIALRREISNVKTMDNVADMVARASGKQYFDEFRNQVELFKRRENNLLQQRNARFNEALYDGSSSLSSIRENLNWVDFTYGMLSGADTLLISAINMETGINGFLLSGEEAFLEPYNEGSAKLFSLIEQMQEAVSSNRAQVILLRNMADNMQRWQKNIAEKMIELRRSVGENKKMFHLAQLVGEARGHEYFAEFRQIMDEFKAEENRLIVIRQNSNAETVNTTYIVIIASTSIAVILGLGVALLTGASISGPLGLMTQNMSRLADGDSSIIVKGLKRKDEIGDIARALEVFKENKIEADRLLEQDKANQQAEKERILKEQELAKQSLLEREEQEKREKAAAEQLADVVKACASGDFTKRLDTHDKDGIFLSLCEGVNEIGLSADRGLKEIKSVIGALAEGRTNVKMTGEYQGIFKDIKLSLNETLSQLSDIVSQIVLTSHSVADASNKIASGSSALSERTDQQAASLEETAASMEELTSTVQENSDSASMATNLADDASHKAEEGNQIIETVVDAMNSIQESSDRISDIIGVIDQISSQINLLALNAAVEAARAGEAGQGFAVVAGEVRSLAARSADASGEIRALINASCAEVSNGSSRVDTASESLKSILASVQKVSETISEISNASREQALNLKEVNVVIAQMDDMTQKNAALVEQNAATTRSMLKQSEALTDVISFFQTDEKQDVTLDESTLGKLQHLRSA